jgi:thiol-disulfide isomerase/thioredoxin
MARLLLVIRRMPRFLLLVCVCSFPVIARAELAALTTNDISLMLRTGYSSKTVLKELAQRKFADTIDSTQETQLIHAGATPELLLTLKSGTFTLSEEEISRIQERKAADASRRAAETEKSRQLSTLYQSQQARQRAADAVKEKVDQHLIYEMIKGDLVYWHNGAVARYDDAALENKKLFLIYFSAHWCQPCRIMTPGLVNYYNDAASKHPEFELIFISRDKSPFSMENYMRETNMPWPALDYQKIASKAGINKYAGKGIPDLVLVDASGKVLSDSFAGNQYVGPAKVLGDLDAMLTKGESGDVAQAQ